MTRASNTLRIVQLSDFHYAPGPECDIGLDLVRRLMDELLPDLILVTGDLSRNGLHKQFVPVIDFLASYGMDRVRAIPGNRDYLAGGTGPLRPADSDLNYFLEAPDTAIDDPATSSDKATPFLEFFDDVDFFDRTRELCIVGLDSEPVIPDESLRRGIAFLEGSSSKLTRVFCTHRSLLPVPGKKVKEGDILPNAGDILDELMTAGVDLVLCAHLHRVHAWELCRDGRTMAVVNAPSLLDRSPGKEVGLLSYDIERRGQLRATFHSLADKPPRILVDTTVRAKEKRRSG
ncbi:MAG TPA: metallophosphoesterase [Thermomicrobiales bacterium]|nr:metallophosphoesterase [Thermomicrobiales bacterium]HRA31487.1 metallophosphoesterase [Thermomicrobiales bacterium]